MSPAKRVEQIAWFRNPRLWIYVLVTSVGSALVACVVDHFWGEVAGFNSFFFTIVLIPGLLGVERWVNNYSNAGKKSVHLVDDLIDGPN